MPLLDVIIPARHEVHLQKTINSVLTNSEADTNIIVILDGCWPVESIPDHPRVTLIHHTESIGQRAAINEAARMSQADFIMKMDAHVAVDQGFDRKLIEPYQTGELTEADTCLPTMFNLDADSWQPKRHKRTDYMYMALNDKGELRAEYYSRQPKSDKDLDETMALMGPFFLLSRKRFWEQGGCDENHGSWGAQSVEVSCKAWLSGGRLMVNKRTWAAHYFRGHIGFPYPISGRDIDRARKYSKDLWLNDKWPLATRKFRWLVEKFNPPGWEDWLGVDHEERLKINAVLYERIHMEKHRAKWRGVDILKMPTDLLLYERVIWETRPECVVEIGTKFGGSAVFFQDALDRLDDVRYRRNVITIDIKPQVAERDPRITYLVGDSKSPEIVEQVRQMTAGKRTMVVVDGDHSRGQVKWELYRYAPLVSEGCYLVVEDVYVRHSRFAGPGEARDWFLRTAEGKKFRQTNLDHEFLVGVTIGSWLQRTA